MAGAQQLGNMRPGMQCMVAGPTQRPFLPRFAQSAASRSPRRSHSRNLCTRAQVQDEQTTQAPPPKPELAKVADSIGLPTEEGIFGFKPFAETWVGRLAMAGFATSCVEEFITGKGTLQQVGLLTPNPVLFWTIVALATGTSVFAFGRTLSRTLTGNLSTNELKRYSNFLGLSNEASDISETETAMKGVKDGLTGSASELPTDTFQNKDAAKASPSTRVLPEDQQFSNNPGQRYARDVELSNGRAAMLGFLGTVAVEAATGKGILSQVLWYAKLTNLLGPASGF